MGAHLGDFGTTRPEFDLTFTFCGQDFRVHPHASDLDFVEFMTDARSVDMGDVDLEALREDPQKAFAIMNQMTGVTTRMYGFIQRQIHPDDWDRFLAHAKATGQQTQDLMRLSQELTAAIARFPTGELSDSAASPPSVSKRFSGGSSSAARRARRIQTIRAHKATPTRRDVVTERALKLLGGRPDLKYALMMQRRAEQQERAEENGAPDTALGRLLA